MKVKNTSNKIINIGAQILMPDMEVPVSAEIANLPSMKAIAKMGFITISGDEAVVEAPVAEEPAEDTAKKATRTRKAKVEATDVAE